VSWPLPPEYPITRNASAHLADGQEAACDFAGPEGTPIHAIHNALVRRAGWLGDCGLSIDLEWDQEHTNYVARYCHLSSLEGDWQGTAVGAGQVIGYAGSTGLSTGPHLHLALWVNGVRTDPEWYLSQEALMPYVEERIAHLEAKLDYYAGVIDKLAALVNPDNGNIVTSGNITSNDEANPRPPSDPLKWLLGCLYFFSQNRFPGQGTEQWAGFETYRQPPDGNPTHAAWGYGGEAGRMWWMNLLAEANGDLVSRHVIADRIYFQQPKHRDMTTGDFVLPHHYDQFGVPYADAAETNRLGGIQVDYNALDVSLGVDEVRRLMVLLTN